MTSVASKVVVAAFSLIALAGCSSMQSALAPTGVEAERINTLFWIMTIGGGAILALVCVLAGFAIFGGDHMRRRLAAERLITWLGIAFPWWSSQHPADLRLPGAACRREPASR